MPSPFHYHPTMGTNLGPSPSAADFAIAGNFPGAAAMTYFPTPNLSIEQQSSKLDQSAAAMSLYSYDPNTASAATYFPAALYASQPFAASAYSHIPQGNSQQHF